jgi:ABC-type glycerol-3-phosphate transport system permease component
MTEHTSFLTAESGARQHIRIHHRQALLEQIVIYILLILVAVLMIVPLLWAIAASFTPNEKVFEYAYPFSWRAFLPVEFTLEAYQNLFARGFSTALLNTFILGVIVVFVGGLINAMAGFAFARFDFWGKRFLFIFVILVTFLIPVDLTAIPRYILVRDLGWLNTWQGLIVPGLASSLVIFLFRQFFEEIPQDLIDAARVDGASWARLFFLIILPLSTPVLITAALLLFLSNGIRFSGRCWSRRDQNYVLFRSKYRTPSLSIRPYGISYWPGQC